MVCVFLADGFEIIEAMAPIDMLRRASIDVKTVAISDKTTITSSCGVTVICDMIQKDIDVDVLEAVILPGGKDGTLKMEKSLIVQNAIDAAVKNQKYVCAICAAPSILGHKGLLKNKNATAFPNFQKELIGAVISDKAVVTDGKFITAKGAGVSVDFGLEIVKRLRDEVLADEIRETIQCK